MRIFQHSQHIPSALACAIVMFGGSASAYDHTVWGCYEPGCVATVHGLNLALETFDIRLSGNDRHIKTIEWHPNGTAEDRLTSYLTTFTDESGAIDLRSFTRVHTLPEIARRERVSGGPCAGACRLPVNIAADETFILSGFRFEYLEDDARDHHVRSMAIIPGRDADGAFVTVAMSDNNGNRPIDVTVHYLAVQSEFLDGPFSFDSGQRGVPNGFEFVRVPGKAVLEGFSVNIFPGKKTATSSD